MSFQSSDSTCNLRTCTVKHQKDRKKILLTNDKSHIYISVSLLHLTSEGVWVQIVQSVALEKCHGMTSLPLLHPPLATSKPFHLCSAPTLKHACTTYTTALHPLLD